MRVLLTGATGYVGSAVLDALVRAGHEVTVLVRTHETAQRFLAREIRAVVGDLGAPEDLHTAFSGHDAYVHTAFESSARGEEVDRLAIDACLEAARHAGATMIYTSGVWVLGAVEDADETTPVNPIPLVAFRPAHEQRVLAAASEGVRAIVVRPGLVFGGGRGLVGDLLRDAEKGLMRVIGSGENRWPLVYDRDLGDLYARLLAHPTATGIFHATDETHERVIDIVEAIAGHTPARPDIRYMPIAEARAKMGPFADALALDQVVRSPRARAIGWQPTVRGIAGNLPRLFEEWRSARVEV